MAEGLKLPLTSVGQMFPFRGLGGVCGAMGSAQLLALPNQHFSKHVVCCFAIIIAGVALAVISGLISSENPGAINSVRILFALQGASFGVLESFAAVAISSMWGQRQQPWMQAKFIMSSVGAIIAPVLIGIFGYGTTCGIVCFIGFFSLFGLLAEYLVSSAVVHSTDSGTWKEYETQGLLEPDREEKVSTKGYRFLRAADETVLQAEELNILEDTIQVIDEPVPHEDGSVPLHELVPEVFNTVGVESRMNRALSYATPGIVEYVLENADHLDVTLLSNLTRLLLALFICWHIGLLNCYGCWIGTYMIMEDIDSPSHAGPVAAGLVVVTLYCLCQMIGAAYSVPVSVMTTTTDLLRFQLVLLVIATVFVILIPVSTFTFTMLSACFLGLSLSCLYPLAMTVVNDYGATM